MVALRQKVLLGLHTAVIGFMGMSTIMDHFDSFNLCYDEEGMEIDCPEEEEAAEEEPAEDAEEEVVDEWAF